MANGKITLETPRLILRDYRAEDWEQIHVYASIPEFSQYDAWGPNTVEDSKKFVNDMILQAAGSDRYQYNFAIELRDGPLIGGCGIRRESQQSAIANLGWAINPEYQNQGFATEAAYALIHFGFTQLHLAVIYATCDARNDPSFKVMEKLKMTRVGHLFGEKMQKGQLRDTLRYEIKR